MIHTQHFKSKNMILQFNPDSSGDYTSIYAYQYPIDQVETGYWTTINTPSGANLNFLDAVEIEDSDGDDQIWASGADGMIYRLFNNSSKNWVDADGSEYPIDTKIQTPYFRPGVLGLEADLAEANACRLEHVVDSVLLERLRSFVRFIDRCPRAGEDWVARFLKFSSEDEDPHQCRQCLSALLDRFDKRGEN